MHAMAANNEFGAMASTILIAVFSCVTVSAVGTASTRADSIAAALRDTPVVSGAMSGIDSYADSRREQQGVHDALPPPPVFFVRDLLPKARCDEIIALCDKHGWSMQLDSIGGFTHPSQDIYVYDVGVNLEPEIMALIKPILAPLVAWVNEEVGELQVNAAEWKRIADELTRVNALHSIEEKEHTVEANSKEQMLAALAMKARNHDLPTSGMHAVDWIFIRKYAPAGTANSTRDHLAGHRDTNQFSVNLPLNSDTEFQDGKLWFARDGKEEQRSETAEQLAAGALSTEDETTHSTSSQRGRNSSRFFVPKLKAGRAMLHNNQVLHGISPVTEGVKYSLLFFLDMPVRAHDQDGYVRDLHSRGSSVIDQTREVDFSVDDDVITHGAGSYLELVWVPSLQMMEHEGHVPTVIASPWGDEVIKQSTTVGHKYIARWKGGPHDGEVVREWVVADERTMHLSLADVVVAPAPHAEL